MYEFLINYDVKFFKFINSYFHNSFFDKIFPYITDFKNFIYIIIGLFILALILAPKLNIERKKIIFMVIILFICDYIASSLLKFFFMRPRPYVTIPNVRQFFPMTNSYSFPSSHAVNITAFGTVLYLIVKKENRKKWLFLFILPIIFIIDYSRIYVGVHYPSDVIFGTFVGFVVSLSLYYFFIFINRKIIKRKR